MQFKKKGRISVNLGPILLLFVVRGAFDLGARFNEIVLVGLDIQNSYTPLYNGPQHLDTYQVSSSVKKE